MGKALLHECIFSQSFFVAARDLGAHLDGFPAVVAHTLIVGSSSDNKVKGKQADTILAAHFASEVALRMLKGGNENYTVCYQLYHFR